MQRIAFFIARPGGSLSLAMYITLEKILLLEELILLVIGLFCVFVQVPCMVGHLAF